MAYVSEMVDQVRDMLSDPDDLQVSIGVKRMYLNRGIAMLWPTIHRFVTATVIPVVADQFDYALPVAVADGMIISVEISSIAAGTQFERFNEYDIISGDEDLAGVLRIAIDTVAFTGYTLRITYAAPIPAIVGTTYTAMETEVWTGPDRALHLPVLYCLAMASMRKIDDRQDHTRISTTQMQNGTTDNDIMSSSQMWMSQFELELEKQGRPLPPARD